METKSHCWILALGRLKLGRLRGLLTANPPLCGGGEPRTIHALRAGAAGGAIRALQYAGVVAGPDGSVAATAPTCELVPGQSAGDGDVVRCDQVVPLTILSRPLTIGERHIRRAWRRQWDCGVCAGGCRRARASIGTPRDRTRSSAFGIENYVELQLYAPVKSIPLHSHPSPPLPTQDTSTQTRRAPYPTPPQLNTRMPHTSHTQARERVTPS